MPTPDVGKATEKAQAASAIFQEISVLYGVADCVRTMAAAHLAVNNYDAAKKTVSVWIEGYKASPDKFIKAALVLVLAEVEFAKLKTAAGLAGAKEAAKIFEEIGDKSNEAMALFHIISAEMMTINGEVVAACEKRVTLFKELADQAKEAAAVKLLAEAFVSQIGLKLATCSIASTMDTIGGLKAAKEAHALFTSLGDRDGIDSALGLFGRVLMYNGVSATVIESMTDPEEIYQDVMSGKYTTTKNAFPPSPVVKQPKVEEIIPTAKQLDRGSFKWMYPNSGYVYTLIWQAVKDRNITNKKPRGSYDVITLSP